MPPGEAENAKPGEGGGGGLGDGAVGHQQGGGVALVGFLGAGGDDDVAVGFAGEALQAKPEGMIVSEINSFFSNHLSRESQRALLVCVWSLAASLQAELIRS